MTEAEAKVVLSRAGWIFVFVFGGMATLAIAMVVLGLILSGTVGAAEIKSKSGARASVATSAQPAFQKLVDWLDAKGYPIKFMGGIRPGKCWNGGMHPCGKAIDINQVARGRVVARLPAGVDQFARSIGLVPGSGWCNQDQGHYQVGGHDGCAKLSKHNIFRRYAEAHAQQQEKQP